MQYGGFLGDDPAVPEERKHTIYILSSQGLCLPSLICPKFVSPTGVQREKAH